MNSYRFYPLQYSRRYIYYNALETLAVHTMCSMFCIVVWKEILPYFFIRFQLDSSEAIKRVLGGEKPSETLARDRKKRLAHPYMIMGQCQ